MSVKISSNLDIFELLLLSIETVRDNLTEVIEPIVYDDAIDLIEEHKLKGHLLVLISASPTEIVEPLAEHLGIDDFIATTPVVDSEGRYTGEVEFYAAGSHKAEAIIDLSSKKNIFCT